ncbi:hypothetical protein DLAC_00057 [Tieghemostelium lacteum]|uniref:TsaA-like domain-containing protein n=1 Tax=Tieghemostelium lacteum TaxID=361077 RepID=A0A152A8N4_TIELA|nr:hypothetical protein DLAC_00057 [Tieghemostelium lacteum]|eukprot:KYR02610.1 hypothetical protein DLAC_00057 [Tieghemostelium lacteum]
MISNFIKRYFTNINKGSITNINKFRITFDPIGYIDSVFPKKYGTPRQGILVKESEGSLKILGKNALHMLKGLEEYSHVWLIFCFHQNQHINSKWNNKENRTELKFIEGESRDDLPPTIRPPRLNGKRIGIFATRSPHRMNDIGLTLCKLERIEKDIVYLSGIDLIHGTPILDIKPYIPIYDNVPDASFPQWILDKPNTIETIEFSINSLENLQKLLNSNTENINEAKELISQVLLSDPRSIYRKKKRADQPWGFIVKNLYIQCQIKDETIALIIDIKEKDKFYSDQIL